MRVQYLFSAICLLFLGSQCAGQASYFRDYERRQQVVDTFEKALIANPTNIFILREIFYPSNDRRRPPSSLYVNYDLQLHDPYLEEVTFNQYVTTEWCRTSVLVQASSLMMLTLSSGLMLFAQYLINKPSSIALSLNISNIEGGFRGFSVTDIEYAVKYITPWLQRYATLESGEKILQQSLSNKDKGYLCQHNSYNLYLVIATAVIVLGIVTLAIVKMYQVSIIKDEFEKKMNLSIILSIGITTFVFNILEIVLNITVLNLLVKSIFPGSLIDQHITTRWIVTIVPIAMFLITAIITGIWLYCCNKSTQLPTFSICCINFKWLYPFIIASFFTFVLIQGANITPAFLTLLNAPQVTSFILIYAVTHFGTIVLMLSIYILSKFQGEKWTKEQSIVGFGSSTLLLLVIGFFAATIYMVTLLSATREESPDLITYVVTLIPSILYNCWIQSKEKLFKYKTTGPNKEEQNDSEIATENNEEGEQQQ